LNKVTALLILLAAPIGAADDDLRAPLAKCAGIKSSVERLDCYDALAERTASSETAKTIAPVMTSPTGTPPSSGQRVSGRCQATTKKGAQCKRNASAGSSHCWQHGG